MTRRYITSIILLLSALMFKAQVLPSDTLKFAALQRDFAGETIGYRKANIAGDELSDKSLVIYLHGGSSSGTDNTTQMNEPGIDSISNYLVSHHIPAVFVVPQCSDRNKGWGGMAKNVKALLDFTLRTEEIDTTRIYIFGGSMGGTGTWKMLSNYPGYFAAAMSCASNPSGMVAENVATTPVYNVMGLDDRIMSENVRATAEAFVSELQSLGGDARYETVEGWSHETTCIQSYSTERLDWVFSHQRQASTGILSAEMPATASDVWYTLQGIRIDKPSKSGIYICNGKKVLYRSGLGN